MKKETPLRKEIASQEIEFAARVDAYMIGEEDGVRYLDLSVKAPSSKNASRLPLALAIVIDRSGSMHGNKIETAKEAALAVISKLSSQDCASVVVFDNEVETVLPFGPMTAERQALARARLSTVKARGGTALHQGWLDGCASISLQRIDNIRPLSRCFLLTDGEANEGLCDPEQIAAGTAELRNRTDICTSTFGIGEDYNELLLAPMAVAGNGQFTHLRNEEDIAAALSGELSELFEIAARGISIEIQTPGAVKPEVVSLYWCTEVGDHALRIDLGDLVADEQRHVVVRLLIDGVHPGMKVDVRSRITYIEDNTIKEGSWLEVTFEGADRKACKAEARDPEVVIRVGMALADRARKEALDLNGNGMFEKAILVLESAIARIRNYADSDLRLIEVLRDLNEMIDLFKERRFTAAQAKEAHYQTHLSSRMQRDHRSMQLQHALKHDDQFDLIAFFHETPGEQPHRRDSVFRWAQARRLAADLRPGGMGYADMKSHFVIERAARKDIEHFKRKFQPPRHHVIPVPRIHERGSKAS